MVQGLVVLLGARPDGQVERRYLFSLRETLMRFGGHQTFAIRDGWLFKGLRLIAEDPTRYQDPDLAEWLGVGKNMAKSIRHWLLATGLAAPDPAYGKRTRVLKRTPLGDLVWRHDRYFEFPGTWWVVHVRLVHALGHAYSWSWFFNRYSAVRFEKPTCVEALGRHLKSMGGRLPAQNTLDRDIGCMLRSYAVSVPARIVDPEDALDCPLSELGLLMHSRHSGFYHVNRGFKPVPHEIFAYAVASARATDHGSTGRSARSVDYSLAELAHARNAPGRVFAVTEEALFALLSDYESRGAVRMSRAAGERVAAWSNLGALEWLERYYERMVEAAPGMSRVA